MTVAIDLRPGIEAEVTRRAGARETTLPTDIEALVAEALKRQPPPPPPSAEEQRAKNQAALEIFQQWDEEDETNDPEEIARRQAEWEEFRKGMNEHHSSGRVIYP